MSDTHVLENPSHVEIQGNLISREHHIAVADDDTADTAWILLPQVVLFPNELVVIPEHSQHHCEAGMDISHHTAMDKFGKPKTALDGVDNEHAVRADGPHADDGAAWWLLLLHHSGAIHMTSHRQ